MVVHFFHTTLGMDNHEMRTSVESESAPEEFAREDLTPSWHQDAECVHYTGRVDFFPARGESVREAKAVCAVCTVREECLDFALRLKVAHGVWGGLSERERRSVRRDRRRASLS
jgi:WhiB family redox-sensing transcriptional regulator